MIKLFLVQGNSIDGTELGKRTALYYAAKKGLVSTMTMLLERGADPNIFPTGRIAWEDSISDDIVLSRLRQAGYRKRSIDPETEHQIRLAIKERAESSVQGRSALTRSLAHTQRS
jgi:ankyrin repeat protein